ncbi:ABC transporter ATP-binding protein [Bifidobacterium pullorum subsp. saeculare]|uniref:ABC transporter ATP-binding protein n=1 Tax=Bifidobacterium pullorum subsp. saeculare TaxID=78257 RepID=A0A939B9I3_9BIFI|nr:ABC transporter ATP-binding protein [Bifidobacterium pullorum]MBM6699543.1 ABC transporter ATP-binding protein [Bifidobacterium pullorum subsp. saeculare]
MADAPAVPQGTPWSFDEYIAAYRRHAGHPLAILLRFLAGNAKDLTIAMFGLVAKQSPVWVIPIVTRNIINVVTYPDRHHITELWLNLSIGLGFILQNIVTNWLYAYHFGKVNRTIEQRLRGSLIVKLQHLSIRFHNETQTGRLLSKVMRDVENVEVLLDQMFRSLPLIVLDIAIAITVTAFASPKVLLFFVCSVPVAVLAIYAFRKPIRDSNHDFRSQMEHTQAAVAEMLEMIPVTRAHGLQQVEIDHMGRHLSRIRDTGLHLDVINGLFGATSWVVFQAFQLGCLAFTSWLALTGQIQIGDVVLFQTYFAQIVNGISGLINLYPVLTRGIESVSSIGEILQETDVECNARKVEPNEIKGDVEFRSVDFRYSPDYPWVLRDYSLTVPAGQSVALVGDSGSGKSTLLNLLIGFAEPEAGQVLVDGVDLSTIDLDAYRRQIAVVPQNTILFSGTLRDNITYGLADVDDAEVDRVIREVGLEDVVDALPEGVDTPLGEHGGTLSGGQRQRIAIARALIRRPRIIIFNEATSALDSVSEKQVQQATERMMSQCTTFLVAHRLSTIRNADRIVVMEHGRIVEEGTYDELMAKRGKFFALKKLQE